MPPALYCQPLGRQGPWGGYGPALQSVPSSCEPSGPINQRVWLTGSLPHPPHHLVQSNPVPGAAQEVCGQGVADQHVVLHGPQALG